MSPVRMRKLPSKLRWRVRDGSRVTAKSTTKRNAQRQVNLLRGVAHGMRLR